MSYARVAYIIECDPILRAAVPATDRTQVRKLFGAYRKSSSCLRGLINLIPH